MKRLLVLSWSCAGKKQISCSSSRFFYSFQFQIILLLKFQVRLLQFQVILLYFQIMLLQFKIILFLFQVILFQFYVIMHKFQVTWLQFQVETALVQVRAWYSSSRQNFSSYMEFRRRVPVPVGGGEGRWPSRKGIFMKQISPKRKQLEDEIFGHSIYM